MQAKPPHPRRVFMQQRRGLVLRAGHVGLRSRGPRDNWAVGERASCSLSTGRIWKSPPYGEHHVTRFPFPAGLTPKIP